MTAPVFVDSSVLLYAVDAADPEKQQAASHWRAELWESQLGRVSFQVLNEFYVNAVRLKPSSTADARAEVRDLLAWNPVLVDTVVIELGWKLQDRVSDCLSGFVDRGCGQGRLLRISSHRRHAGWSEVGRSGSRQSLSAESGVDSLNLVRL